MSAPVFITVPKYVAITPQLQTTIANNNSSNTTTTVLTKIKPAPQNNLLQMVDSNMASDSDSSSCAAPAPKGKKRRLDHLTWEEKIQRKKLKNRVAAQTSRDRKKARMEEMEGELHDLTQRTEILVNKCESLQVINDSLLEKNQKLDMEVELLRQELQELQKQQQQQQHTVNTCAGWLKPQGLSVDTGVKRVAAEKTVKEELNSLVTVACNSSLPSLQDMLLPELEIDEGTLNDAEFDASKLEELAESLLADIEASNREINSPTPEIPSSTERLPGSVVGTATECLESGQHTSQSVCGLSLSPIIPPTVSPHLPLQSLQTPELTLESKFDDKEETTHNVTITETPKTITSTVTASMPATVITTTPDTVYGTYDAKTNSITVVMDDVAVPVNEVVEEIYWDGARASPTDEMMSSGVASPSQVYLNVTTCSDDEDDDDDFNNFDPIAKFLCPKRPLVSPLAKSPAPSLHSATSDHGYESILGSPPSHFELLSDDLTNDFCDWPPGFNELFPSLI